MNALHPFEKSGLGLAPFRFIGHERKVGPIKLPGGFECGAPGQPMGVCQHCGTGIADCFWVESSDGQKFYVGCDCIEKLYRESNRSSSQLARDPFYREFKREKNRIAAARRHEREAETIAEFDAWAAENKSKLSAIPNPDREGESLWDRYEWFSRNAGNAGKIRLFKQLQVAADKPVDPAAIAMAAKKAITREMCRSLRESEAKYAAQRAAERYVVENAWLVRVLESAYQGDFVTSMIRHLERAPISDLPERALDILCDIYAKSHGRRNSKKYEAAWLEFEKLAGLVSSVEGKDI